MCRGQLELQALSRLLQASTAPPLPLPCRILRDQMSCRMPRTHAHVSRIGLKGSRARSGSCVWQSRIVVYDSRLGVLQVGWPQHAPYICRMQRTPYICRMQRTPCGMLRGTCQPLRLMQRGACNVQHACASARPNERVTAAHGACAGRGAQRGTSGGGTFIWWVHRGCASAQPAAPPPACVGECSARLAAWKPGRAARSVTRWVYDHKRPA